MGEERSFFEANLKPIVEEIENASQALNSLCEELDNGMCFLLKDTLCRIARDFNAKIGHWEKEFVVSKKLDKDKFF